MSAGSFKQDGLGWRINQIRQRFSEWLEYQIAQIDVDWDWDWDGWDTLWQIIKFFLWSIIAVILVWFLWQLWLLVRPYWKNWQRTTDVGYPVASQSETIQLSSDAWLEKSQAARVDGNYRQAIFCLYQGMLQSLHERNILSAQSSRTDLEYRRSLQELKVAAFPAYELLLSMHQRLCFGQAEADRNLFEECQQAYQQINDSPA